MSENLPAVITDFLAGLNQAGHEAGLIEQAVYQHLLPLRGQDQWQFYYFADTTCVTGEMGLFSVTPPPPDNQRTYCLQTFYNQEYAEAEPKWRCYSVDNS